MDEKSELENIQMSHCVCHTAPAECRCLRACHSIPRRASERMGYIHTIVMYGMFMCNRF